MGFRRSGGISPKGAVEDFDGVLCPAVGHKRLKETTTLQYHSDNQVRVGDHHLRSIIET